MYDGKITDVPGIEVGHAQDFDAKTGCTVVISREGAIGGVDVRGSAPGTRETDLMRPMNLVEKVHAVVLCGGSAFGLAAASGVMRYLEERGIGFDAGVAKVPIVAGAVIFDLGYGDWRVRPDENMGYQACLNASASDVPQGSVGAGTGATVGKILGMECCMKGGVGTSSIRLPGGIVVGAIVVVNALGDVVDPKTGRILAGARHPKTGAFIDTWKFIIEGNALKNAVSGNTTIGVVATNARLTKEQANKVAAMAHDGLALAIRPVHTMLDGDTLFALSTGKFECDVNVIGIAAAEAVARAVVNAVENA
ncbi:L-aminopeptidase/D-esterase-like protein [Caldicoprobacter guelmensis]|uniref:P1 family peptidase n=1 Tax=Caldicoprobacter guelmensis TaxID=1170224 RepID=UPI00195C5E9D|nr:P1 family peptidase [Caldicoprobacter guelmensis]MBM7582262.1 L-aminopeptidase/D-esterase-like protein [Caldicoprobacter guelmensis]